MALARYTYVDIQILCRIAFDTFGQNTILNYIFFTVVSGIDNAFEYVSKLDQNLLNEHMNLTRIGLYHRPTAKNLSAVLTQVHPLLATVAL